MRYINVYQHIGLHKNVILIFYKQIKDVSRYIEVNDL